MHRPPECVRLLVTWQNAYFFLCGINRANDVCRPVLYGETVEYTMEALTRTPTHRINTCMQSCRAIIYLWRLLKCFFFIQFTAAARMHVYISVVRECARFRLVEWGLLNIFWVIVSPSFFLFRPISSRWTRDMLPIFPDQMKIK